MGPSEREMSNNEGILTSTEQQPLINKRYVVLVCLIISLGGFLFGYDLNVIIGGIIFLRRHFHLEPMALGFAVGVATLGCGAGAVAGGYIADRLGRKKALAITAVIFAIGSIGTAVPVTIEQFNLFRLAGGVAVGLASVVSPMYIAEISPTHLRGRLVTINQFAMLTGAVISVSICYFLSLSGNWRTMFGSEAVPALVLLAALPILPQSPRWLLEKALAGQARQVLAKVYREHGEIEREVERIFESLANESGSFRELFRPGFRRPMIVAVVLAIFMQFTGIGPLGYYFPVIFQKAGFQRASDALYQMIFVNIWLWISTVLALWLVDRVGRRPLLISGVTAMAVGMVWLGAIFSCNVTGEVVVIATMFCLGAYVATLGPLFWLLASELFPTRLRGKGVSVASTVHWSAMYVATQYIPSMLADAQLKFNNIGVVFWVFAAICVAAIVFSYYMVPETKDRSLEDIGDSWTVERTSP
jgi:sugar porter (SP) family MFS transporter